MGTPAWIGLGSNRGDRRAYLDQAIAALAATPGIAVRALSGAHETPPVGGPEGQDTFLNAAAALETSLEPGPLLDVLNAVEADAGRVRGVRWGQRTLDLDILLFGDRVLDTPRLTIPHPLMALRRFVLAPLDEIAGMAIDPTTGLTVAALLANLDRRPSVVALHGGDRAVKADVSRSLARSFAECNLRSERWLLADFCPFLEPEGGVAGLQGRPPRPTFTVVLGPDPEGRPQRAPIPRYRARASTVEAIVAEVVVVCMATRAGR